MKKEGRKFFVVLKYVNQNHLGTDSLIILVRFSWASILIKTGKCVKHSNYKLSMLMNTYLVNSFIYLGNRLPS